MLATAVTSKTLATVAYDVADQVLRLTFRNHTLYCYFGVPAAVHQGLLEAESKGAYFNRCIRNRFPYQKVALNLSASLPTATP
jgi:hypothetical protein